MTAAPHPRPAEVTRARRLDLHTSWLRLTFQSDQWADFHYAWLWQLADGHRHPLTRERQVGPADVPADIAPRVALITPRDTLFIEWSDGLNADYSLYELHAQAYATQRPLPTPPPSDLAPVTLALAGSIAAWAPAVSNFLARHGVCIVRARGDADAATPEATEAWISALKTQGLEPRATHFGRIEDLRPDNTTNQNTDQLGYTQAAVDLHTDQPFLEHPPRYQLLHCIVPAASGGDSTVADALVASQYLRATDHETWRWLSEVPVRFHRKQKAFEAIVDAPIFGLSPDGRFIVRDSYFTFAPLALPFEQQAGWRRAYTRYTDLVRSPGHHRTTRLEAGDVLIYDNHRMLHARTAFSGHRWLRGVYFDPQGAPA